MSFRKNARDLAHAGLYVVGLGIVFASFAFAAAVALQGLPDSALYQWTTGSVEAEDATQETRINRVVANAREIREALAKPIPRPAALTPITEKVAYGHLKPGAMAQASKHPVEDLKRKLPKAALNAMAMDQSPTKQQAFSTPPPELHKVY